MNELVRALVILPVVVLLPLAGELLHPRRRRAIVALVLGIIALAPYYKDAGAYVVVAARATAVIR